MSVTAICCVLGSLLRDNMLKGGDWQKANVQYPEIPATPETTPSINLVVKESVNQSDRPLMEGLAEEAYLFDQTLRTDGAKRNMRKFLEIGGQTREGELRMGDLAAELGEG